MKRMIAAEIAITIISSVVAVFSGYAGIAIAVWVAMILILSISTESRNRKQKRSAARPSRKREQSITRQENELYVQQTRKQLIHIWESLRL